MMLPFLKCVRADHLRQEQATARDDAQAVTQRRFGTIDRARQGRHRIAALL